MKKDTNQLTRPYNALIRYSMKIEMDAVLLKVLYF